MIDYVKTSDQYKYEAIKVSAGYTFQFVILSTAKMMMLFLCKKYS